MTGKGTGIFSWDGKERRSDRYGSFTLDKTNYDGDASFPEASFDDLSSLVGLNVKITAVVVESRVSGHVGDKYRGIKPSRPETGEIIELGIGKLFIEESSWSGAGIAIGIEPSDGRRSDWFDPEKLYRLHDQTVTVTVTETDETSSFVPNYKSDVGDTSTFMTDHDLKGGYIQYKGLHWME